MTEHPQCWDDITWKHKVVHHTFMPVVLIVFSSIIISPILWYFDVLSFRMTLVTPWVALTLTIVYISTFDEYVIPTETYRKYRNGTWDNSDHQIHSD